VKAVLDTNVLILAFVFPGGKPEAVYRFALEGRLEIGTSRPLLAEFGRVLERKFGWDPDRVEAAVAQMTRIATVVEPSEVVQVIAADPADDRVLESGRAHGADVIVSGDQHLLDLGAWSEIEIVSPAGFIARWGA
jgi:putative PIN family toxin of toxin-antitoxin system